MGKIIGAFAITGPNSLASYTGDTIDNGDAAIVFSTIAIRIYILNSTSGEPEDIPRIVAPSINPGDKRWELISTQSTFDFLSLNQDIIPDFDELRTIGTTNKNWKTIFLKALYVNNQKFIEDTGAAITLDAADKNIQLKTLGTNSVEIQSNVTVQGGKTITTSDTSALNFNVPLKMNTKRITNLASPTTDSDAATRGYVNNRVANAANITVGTLPSNVLPPIAITTVTTANSEIAMLALTLEEGDIVVRTDINRTFIHNNGTTGTISDFVELQSPGNTVLSVNAKTGSIILNQDDIGDGIIYKRTHNDFTTSLLTKLNEIETNATGDQTAAEILSLVKTVDGSGSGLDADSLDGLNSTNFLRSDASTVHNTGQLRVDITAGANGNMTGYPSNALAVFQPTVNADAFLSFHISGDYACNFGLDGSTNDFFVGGWSMGAIKNKIWHEGNTPISTYPTANTVMKRDGNGDSYIRYLFSTYLNMSHGPSGSIGDTIFYSSTDDYIRKNNRTGFLNSLGFKYLNGTAGQAYYSDYGLKAQWGYSSPNADQTWVYFPTNFDAGQQHVRVFLQMKTGSSTDLIAKVLTVYSNAFAWGITLNNGWVQTTGVYWLAIGLN